MNTDPDPDLRDSRSDEGGRSGNLQPRGVNSAVQREPQELGERLPGQGFRGDT